MKIRKIKKLNINYKYLGWALDLIMFLQPIPIINLFYIVLMGREFSSNSIWYGKKDDNFILNAGFSYYFVMAIIIIVGGILL